MKDKLPQGVQKVINYKDVPLLVGANQVSKAV